MKFLSLLLFPLILQGSGLRELRDKYEEAALNDDAIEAFSDYLNKITDESDQTVMAYRSVERIFMARQQWNPFGKLESFNEGSESLDECIKNDPENLEIRYLRLAIQMNAPGFLGYNSEIEEDKVFLLQNLGACSDSDLKKRIASYLLKEAELSETEKTQLKKETGYLFTSSN